jgi:hypothetical protein
MACNAFLRGLEQTNGIAVDLGGDVVEREEQRIWARRELSRNPPSQAPAHGRGGGSEQAGF